MWEGKYDKKLDSLHSLYVEKFDQEPDEDMDLNSISYDEWTKLIRKSLVLGTKIQN